MLESPWTRAVVAVACIAGLVGLGVWFGSLPAAPETGDYPGAEALGTDYDGHVGERVEVAGRVVETGPVVVVARYPGGSVRLTVRGLDRPVERGDTLWLVGVVEPGHQVRVDDAVVLTPGGMQYARGVSVLAGLWVLARLVRDWGLDRSAWGLAPRDGGDPADADETTGGGRDA